jgi:hypothetical protein
VLVADADKDRAEHTDAEAGAGGARPEFVTGVRDRSSSLAFVTEVLPRGPG